MKEMEAIALLRAAEVEDDWGYAFQRCLGGCRQSVRKAELLRFLSLVPRISRQEALVSYAKEYFPNRLPEILRFEGAEDFSAAWIETLLRNLRSLTGRYSVQNPADAAELRDGEDNQKISVLLLGEGYTRNSEVEGQKKLIRTLISSGIDLVVRPTSIVLGIRASNHQDSVQRLVDATLPLCREAMAAGTGIILDMELSEHKDIVLDAYRRLRSDAALRDYPRMGITILSCLRSAADDVDALLRWAQDEEISVCVRLARGLNWQFECVNAKQKGHEVPVWTEKERTDAAYLAIAEKLFAADACLFVEFHTHNVHTIAGLKRLSDLYRVPGECWEIVPNRGVEPRYIEALRGKLGNFAVQVPVGGPGETSAYVRTLFLQARTPESLLSNLGAADPIPGNEERTAPRPDGFRSYPFIDYRDPRTHQGFAQALAEVHREAPLNVPLYIGGEKIRTGKQLPSLNPSNPEEIIARVSQASRAEADKALQAAFEAQKAWTLRPVQERSDALFRAAAAAKRRRWEISALMVLEVGKQWDQALHDTNEGIDFLDFYARDILRIMRTPRIGNKPGEHNYLLYQGKGVSVAIPPWNFPFAIAIGMCAAAIAAGNSVVLKPSSFASAVGYAISECFEEAGLPDGVFNYCPGAGREIGDFMIEDPRVSLISFTGSMEVGLHIQKKAAVVQKGQKQCRRVIAEMGGKNAIILDRDIPVAPAIGHVIYAAFGYQGQKCSACSRLIVHESIYDEAIEELVERAKRIRIGPCENPDFFMGAVIDAGQREKVLDYIEIADREGRITYKSEVPAGKGYFVPITIVEGILPRHRIAQEEIFGPVLAVMKVKDFDEALEYANSTIFGLTGALFSVSPVNIARAGNEFNVGNLYINQASTGALVNRQPFGGYYMSGIGSKTGGPDYLLQFMDPKTVTYNQVHSRFSPILEDDEWL